MTFSDLAAQHAGLAARKQLALGDFLGQHSWQLDLDRGQVDFGKSGLLGRRRVYPVQVVGTEAEDSGTWLWAWANVESGIPGPLLKAAHRLRAFGEKSAVEELVTPELPSAEYPGHLLTSVASGICGADAYYRGPYPGGAVFFLISETPLAAGPPPTLARISTVLTGVISEFELDHRAVASAYLRAEGFRLTETATGFTAASDAGALSLSFDAQGRLAEFSLQGR
jgi:hypothetical protein